MNKLSFIIILFVCIALSSLSLNGQCVNVTLSTQSQVNNFAGDCDEVVNLSISGDDITNVYALYEVVKITGNLSITAENLDNFEGFENLTTVEGNFYINGVKNPVNLQGFNNLEEVGGNFTVLYCDGLQSFSGMGSLSEIGGIFSCSNPNLHNLVGMENLSSCGVINFSSWDAIVNFEGLESLTTIEGNFILHGDDALEDFTGLESLQSIGGKFSLENNDALACFCGLENLTEVGSDLNIHYNNALMGLAGLENLSSVGGQLIITDNSKLESCSIPSICTLLGEVGSFEISDNKPSCNSSAAIQQYCGTTYCPESLTSIKYQSQIDHFKDIFPTCDILPGDFYLGSFWQGNQPGALISDLEGLSQLTRIDGRLAIVGLGATSYVRSLNGLQNLEYIGGDFELLYADSIETIEHLSALDTIKGYFRLDGCEKLANTSGLTELKYIGTSFIIRDNQILEEISGFEQLETINEYMSITLNPNLESIQGLNTVNNLLESITITDNPALDSCSVWPVCNLIDDGEYVDIEDNGNGCNSQSEVYEACGLTFSNTSGIVFIDLDCDGVKDDLEPVKAYHLLSSSINDDPFSFTDENGGYSRLLGPNYPTDYYPDVIENYSPNPEEILLPLTNEVLSYEDQNFAFCADFDFHNIRVDFTSVMPPRPGFENQYLVCIENVGASTENASLLFNFSNGTSDFINIIDAEEGNISNNTVTWEVENLTVFENRCYSVTANTKVSTELGAILEPTTEAIIESNSETNLEDNLLIREQEVVGSYDPNDKQVWPEIITPTEISEEGYLEYLIRFQNTGNFPATFIEVIDTIGQNLDIRSFKMLAASHAYTVRFLENNAIRWRFDNINLADSTSNEAESHGFIKFKMRFINDLADQDKIQNRASIYFDFNEPIVTNYAITTVDLSTELINADKNVDIQIMPNPASEFLLVKLSDILQEEQIEFSIFDFSGNRIKQFKKSNNHSVPQLFEVPLEGIRNGVYFIQLRSGEAIAAKKLIVLNQ